MEFTEMKIATMSKKSVQAVRKLLYGKDGNQHKIEGGLCKKTYWNLPGQSEVDIKTKYIIEVSKHLNHMKSDFAWIDQNQ